MLHSSQKEINHVLEIDMQISCLIKADSDSKYSQLITIVSTCEKNQIVWQKTYVVFLFLLSDNVL
jgi:hypothetical protein